MSPERNGSSHKETNTLKNSESLIVNASLGFFFDESKLLVFDLSGQTLTSQTCIPNSTAETLNIGEAKISHKTAENGSIEITIESEKPISTISCSYRFPFEKKFEYEKTKREAEQEAI